ncbi:MAG: hypothetical protein QOE90_3320 [Thermoplasmata archaeon]|jgi:hypothetical protein|nr:hypothetical protein [Thermoplasmata archaeon]
MDWNAFVAATRLSDWVIALATLGSFAVAAVVAVFTYRLMRIEASRQTPKLRIHEAIVYGNGVRVTIDNAGHHATALASIKLIQNGQAFGIQESEPGRDQQGNPATSPTDPVVEPGRRVTLTITHFIPPLWSNADGRVLRITPVLGDAVEAIVDVNEVARALRLRQEGKR